MGGASAQLSGCGCTPTIKAELETPNQNMQVLSQSDISCGDNGCEKDDCKLRVEMTQKQDACIVAGRPFTVPVGAPLVAKKSREADTSGWVDSGVTIEDSMSDAALAEYWHRSAMGEHASVASFSRASLELMGVGAPPSLIEAVHKAAMDEIRHARTAFGLAKLYGHPNAAPGVFPVPAQLEVSKSMADIAVKTFKEGCEGETVAAAQARFDLEHVAPEGPMVDALRVVVADEARHAGLAWRTVAWLLSVGGDDVAASLAAERLRFSERSLEKDSLAMHMRTLVTLPWIDSLLEGSKVWPSQLVRDSKRRDLVTDCVLDTAEAVAKELSVWYV